MVEVSIDAPAGELRIVHRFEVEKEPFWSPKVRLSDIGEELSVCLV